MTFRHLLVTCMLYAAVVAEPGHRAVAFAQGENPVRAIQQDRIDDPQEEGPGGQRRRRQEPIDEVAVRLREVGQAYFTKAQYVQMAATYLELCARPGATIDDHLWQGHAHQLARNWPAACEAYQGALRRLDAEIAATDVQLRELEDAAKGDESILFVKGSKYPFLKRAQEELPRQWPDLVLQLGMLELVEWKNPAAAAKTLSQGLRYAPELARPLDQLLESADAVLTKKVAPPDGLVANQTIVPLETQRFLALAQEQLEQPAAALDTWVRVRLCKIAANTAYATTDPAHLKELASKLPQDSLKPPHLYALKNPDRERVPQRESKDFLNSGTANPFRAVSLPGFEFTMGTPSAANLAKLSDGRWIMAYATGDHHQARIKLSLSKDGRKWDTPWEFAHNSIFNTRAPSLVVDDAGEIWMLCLSQRLTTQRFASAPYHLWLTHSPNGRDWTPLRVLQMETEPPRIEIAASQYQEIPQLMRVPGGRFGILWRDSFGAARSPGEIETLQTLPLNGQSRVVSNTQATFESNGRCHLVFDDFGRSLYYTRSDDMQTWSPLQSLGVAEPNSSISMPQLLIEGDHVALIHERNNGWWLLRGKIVPSGLELGESTQIAAHTMPLHGARLRVDGDRVLILAGGQPYVPQLLTARFADLLAPSR